MQLRALRQVKIADTIYYKGEIFPFPLDRDWRKIVRLKGAEIVTDERVVSASPTIIKAGPRWRKVMLGDEQIGKTVGSDEEAEKIIEAWRNGEYS